MQNILFTRQKNKPDCVKSLAIGKFDGMHLAHQELLKNLDQNGAILCIKTNENFALTPLKEKYTKLPIFYLNLDCVKDFSGQEFCDFLLANFQNLKKIVVGYDFRFGKNRAFNAQDLQNFLPQIQVQIFDEFFVQNISAHSKNIKDFILNGDMKRANALLGRHYSIFGKSVKGQQIGSKQLYATINVEALIFENLDSENFADSEISESKSESTPEFKQNFLLPQSGVYASFTSFEGKFYKSVSFIGNRLSTDKKFSIETHILEQNISTSPQFVEIFFVQKLRDNQTFENLNSLKNQISKDIQNAMQILKTQEAQNIF